MKQPQEIHTSCCIAGGGPAGMMLGYLMARAGIDVTVLEKWPDFFRDFRGDTIHPSTMDVLYELGLLQQFLQLPHNETKTLAAHIGSEEFTIGDFTHLHVHCNFLAFIPQWDFLNFLGDQAKQFPSFRLHMGTEAVGLLNGEGGVSGVQARSENQTYEIKAGLVVGADGRSSTLREKAGMAVENLGAPMDVLWFRVPRMSSDPGTTLGRVNFGKVLIMIDRDTYWQCGFIIRKGSFDEMKRKGLDNFYAEIARLAPFMQNRMSEISNWDQVKLLSVVVDHLRSWYREHLLFIGDAAHAMSPIGGVGINLAIQDAVAAGNILIPKLRQGSCEIADLQAVQQRREEPTRKTQKLQVFIQNHIIEKVLQSNGPNRLPWFGRLLLAIPGTNRIPARVVGLGFQPEHVAPGLFS